MIKIENLALSFGKNPVFRDLSLTVNKGDIVGIIGPSGCGKSLLLRCIMTLRRPDSGKIFFSGEEITAPDANLNELRKKIGMVFQSFNLFEHMTVVENVMSGPVHLQKTDKRTAFDSAMALIKSVGLADRAYYYPYQLSGGQQQRAAIARTLAMNPDVVLLDEPTSSLDPMVRGEVESVIRMMAAEGRTMIIVSHEMELIKQICNRVVFLSDGVVYEEGTPEKIFNDPGRTLTRRFVRALRVLEFDVQSKDFDFIGAQTTIAEYAYRIGMPDTLAFRLQAIMEELFQMVIIQPAEQHKMHVSFEYNNVEKFLSGVVRFSGPKVDPDDPMYFFSWPLIVKRSSEITLEEINDNGYTNMVTIKIE